ncbi:hypothetical protein MSSAC_2792 [Methanosarcina siciliae C2J]|uniref:Uncharacterized protein n=1 Tax=Methanosarcina siciliae C2J TaxID=1434118 RepID=A0A0E3PQ12_9EURY|nr:hypothetical protein [Methanosarcina siciliae]AKB37382.1 hypothetical protein MSSAC_2792 [Methanosarcina siciliae C2J]
MSTIVEGIDLDLLLEDQARLTKRVAELEDNQETIVRFLRRAFPKKANQLKKLLKEPETVKKIPKAKTALGQEDDELTTKGAIMRCFTAKPVSNDPIIQNSGISWPKKRPEISEGLGG